MTKKSLNNLFFIIGVVAVVVMLLTFDVSFIELWEHLCHAGYWLIPIIGIWAVVYGINALSWRVIIRSVNLGSAPSRPSAVLAVSPTASWNCRRTSATSVPPRR